MGPALGLFNLLTEDLCNVLALFAEEISINLT